MQVHLQPVTWHARVYPAGMSFDARDKYVISAVVTYTGEGTAYLALALGERMDRDTWRSLARELLALGIHTLRMHRRKREVVRDVAAMARDEA